MTLNYRSDVKDKITVHNVESLPSAKGCKYLLAITSHLGDNHLIAKQWKRKEPKQLNQDEVLIKF